MEEIWKPVVGYEGMYEVSNLGRVKSLNYKNTGKEVVLKAYSNKSGKGYYKIHLCKNGVVDWPYVHILVAQAFIPNPDNLPEVNHKDENPANNCVENLEWCTHKYNSGYSNEKEICQYSLDGVLIRVWPSMQKIEQELGYKYQNISACCRGLQKTAFGFIWKYKEPQVS